jgi:hypothetical protein
MEHFIDRLSRQLARFPTRRAILGFSVRATVAAFFASTRTAKLFAESLDNCPDCGTCQICDLGSGICTPACPPCTTRHLCHAANKNAKYQILNNYLLNARGFVAAGGPEAVGVHREGKRILSLATFYSSTESNHTAALFFQTYKHHGEREKQGDERALPFAVEYSWNSPVFAYTVSEDNEVSIHLGPVVPGTLFAIQPSQPLASAEAAANATSCPASEKVCSSLCGFVAEGLCGEGVPLLCGTTFLVQPELVPLCVIALGILCLVGAGRCAVDCIDYLCACPDGCFGCDKCQDGTCVPINCGSGLICRDGSCTENCASGTVPCPDATGAVRCAQPGCPPICPSGQVLCGTGCCVPDQCIQAQCINNSCPTGWYPCGPAGGCCEDGTPCCGPNADGQFGCGPAGYICCSDGGACGPDTTCCIAGNSHQCCSVGENCCVSGGVATCSVAPC